MIYVVFSALSVSSLQYTSNNIFLRTLNKKPMVTSCVLCAMVIELSFLLEYSLQRKITPEQGTRAQSVFLNSRWFWD